MIKKSTFLLLISCIFCANLFAQNCNPSVDTNKINIACKDSAQLFAGFSKINKSKVGNNTYSSIVFTNPNNGFAVGIFDSVVTTTNGGASWTSTKINNLNYAKSISFPNSTVGYICPAYVDSTVLKTTDGGTSWNPTVSYPGNCILKTLFFLDSDTGFVAGFSNDESRFSTFMRTYNGGISWKKYDLPMFTPNAFESMWFTSGKKGFALSFGRVVMTTDGGDTWQIMNSDTMTKLNSIFFSDQNTGYAVGDGGRIIKTVDGGSTWEILNHNYTNQLNSLYFTDNKNGFTAGWGIILRTIDGGQTWHPIYDDQITKFASIFFQDPTTGYAIAEDGTLLKITDIDNATFSWLPTIGLDNPNSPTPIAKPAIPTTYTATITPNPSTGCNNSYVDSVTVNYIPTNTPAICLVSIRDTKNFLVWDKPINSNIDSFYIWRESDLTDVYEKIGSTAYTDSCVFTDNSSNSEIQSNKYKISILDVCGMESNKSEAHRTIHLSINQGCTLIWQEYLGFNVDTYKIFRGTSIDSLYLIGSTAGSNNQFTDNLAPEGKLYYQISGSSSSVCNPSKGYNSTRSNIASTFNNGIATMDYSKTFNISPNPNTGHFNIKFTDNTNQEQVITITNILGNIVYKETIPNQSDTKLDLSNLANGIYTISVSNATQIITKKIIIQK